MRRVGHLPSLPRLTSPPSGEAVGQTPPFDPPCYLLATKGSWGGVWWRVFEPFLALVLNPGATKNNSDSLPDFGGRAAQIYVRQKSLKCQNHKNCPKRSGAKRKVVGNGRFSLIDFLPGV